MLQVVEEAMEGQGRENVGDMDLDALAREGARRMPEAALLMMAYKLLNMAQERWRH